MSANIYIVEDEEPIITLIKYNLEKEGYKVSYSDNGNDGIKGIKNSLPDLVLLDWMLPDFSGVEICKNLKKDIKFKNIPIIMLTAKGEEEDKIKGLNSGADDYITKPFSPKELILRINSILKRSEDKKVLNPLISFGAFVLNMETRDFSKSGKRIYLTEKELNLLMILAQSPGQPLSREDLAGIDEPGRAVDVGINRLRKKIEDDPTMPIWLQTVRGKGYILRPNW